MYTYVALLRGINVGGRSIRMSELRICLTKLGLQNVITYIQSGNIIFNADTTDTHLLRQEIEAAVGAQFGCTANIHVYPAEHVAKIVADYPFPTDDPLFQFHVMFMDPPLAKDLFNEATNLDPAIETILLGDGVVYWRVKKGYTVRGEFSKYQAKTKYRSTSTVRVVQTLQKLLALSGA